MAPLLVDSLEKIIKDICRKVILDDVMEKTQSTTSLIKFDVMNENVQKVKAGVGFGLNNFFLKKKQEKVTESQGYYFLAQGMKFRHNLFHPLQTKCQSLFACCYQRIIQVCMTECPYTCQNFGTECCRTYTDT